MRIFFLFIGISFIAIVFFNDNINSSNPYDIKINDDYVKKELISKDGKVKIVLTIEEYGGATGSFRNKLYIANIKNDKLENIKLILEADSIVIKSIEWTSLNTVNIESSVGKVFHFSNYWWNKKNKLTYYMNLSTKN
ncbi:hypothetical protein [Arcobacter sp. LA11]|uniref:hypothetical protein n=1 Tax=Arcobacter sp. LA11 TaxID=1898176 RepID=UPI000932586B|nr:hypothetical protein [Arcobacter sp. LA11]